MIEDIFSNQEKLQIFLGDPKIRHKKRLKNNVELVFKKQRMVYEQGVK
jgi:hypothetical protein